MKVVSSKCRCRGFTMVEAVMALVVAAMVFESIMVILPQSRREQRQEEVQTDFQIALTQLGRQNYQLDRVQRHAIYLKKSSGDLVTVKVAKHCLVLDGAHHGRVLLLQGIDDLCVENLGTYQFLTVFSGRQKKANGILFLPKIKQTATEER